jgi:hypothetical protein
MDRLRRAIAWFVVVMLMFAGALMLTSGDAESLAHVREVHPMQPPAPQVARASEHRRQVFDERRRRHESAREGR